MHTTSQIKAWLKDNTSPSVLRWLRLADSVRRSFHYWIPYNFLDGSAWPPTHLTLDITYLCNLKCEMCPQAIDFEKEESNLLKQYKSRKELTTDQILRLIDDAADYGVRVFSITGGEPFLRKDILTLIERIKGRRMECQLLTNGMLIKPPTAARLVELGVDKLTISVDGPEYIHNIIRKHPSSFQRLIESAKLIQAEKGRQRSHLPYLAFSNTISASNTRHLAELMDVAGQHRVNLNFGYLYYVTEKMEAQTSRILGQILDVDQVKGEDQNVSDALKKIDPEVIRDQIKEIREKERRYRVKANFTPNLTPEEVGRRYEDDAHAYASKCFYAWYHARVNPYGDLYACGPISLSMGNVTEHRLPHIWNNGKYRAFRTALKRHQLFPKCTKCCALNSKLWTYLPAVTT